MTSISEEANGETFKGTENPALDDPSARSRPAPLIRFFGWASLFLIATHLLNNYLVISKGWTSLTKSWSFTGDTQLMTQSGIYLAGFALALLMVLFSWRRSLRADAKTITRFNTYLVRGLFWAVLFIGLVDMAISFLRVEGLLASVVGDEMFKQLSRSQFRGQYVHVPLLALGMIVGLFTRTLGFHWLALLIVIAELAIVFTRFIFSYEQAFMGDLVRFWYAALFLFASAYTLLEDGHVRVDVFYHGLSRRKKGAVNSIGAIILGMSLCWTIIIIGFKGKASIIYGPLANFEVSQSGFGMYTKYWMAGFLAVFAITMLIQFVAQLFEASADARNDPGGRTVEVEVANIN